MMLTSIAQLYLRAADKVVQLTIKISDYTNHLYANPNATTVEVFQTAILTLFDKK